MSGILLGALAYSGLNKTKNKSTEKKNTINYSTNIKNSMDKVEYNQARQNYRKPEYLNQFDDLRFDNIGDPAGENDTYNTLIGYNASLKRDLQARDNFSFFETDKDGTYNIISKDNFVHNNMFPSTTQRDIDKSLSYSQRKMETFTGSSNNVVLKQPNKHLFEPVKDLSYIHGAPVNTDLLKQRYLASNKNNMGNLPFSSKARVLPGVEGAVQQGTYAVYRVNPPTVDQLRIDDNKKISYLNKPLETMKKGEVRGPDFNATKFKVPDFREQKFSDLVANKANVEREKQDGIYTNMNSQRGEGEYYQPGPSNNSTMGDGPDLSKTSFEGSKKENYLNDNARAITDNTFKPVFTNAKAYTVCDNQRSSVNTNYQGGIMLSTQAYSSMTDKAKDTIKQCTSHNIISNIAPDVYETYTNISDKAKPTIKQCTSHNIISNIAPDVNETYTTITDKAKPTIKQCTSHNIISNIAPDVYEGYTNITDKAKQTIRQTTETTKYIGPVNDNNNMATYVEFEDTAKNTIKQTTIDNNYRGNVRTDVNAQISHDAANNMTPNVCREAVVSFNRPANGKADLYGPYIEKKNVEFPDTILYSYAGNPYKALDHSVAPTLSNDQIKNINTIKTNSKPKNQTVSYYINSNYINTLNNNPFVNDIYHQKNYK